jgi:predicted transporter
VTNPVPFRVLTLSIDRLVLGIAVLLSAYLLVPIHPDSTELSAVTWAALLALAGLVGVFAHQTRSINRSQYPLIAGTLKLLLGIDRPGS